MESKLKANLMRLWYRIALGLFSMLLAAVGLTLLFAIDVPKAIASPNWPTTEGIVMSSEVEGSGLSDNAAWYPCVSFRYSVNGKEYTSESIEVFRVGNGNSDYFARQVVERYPAGERVRVFYSPANPAVALLEPGIPDNGFFAPVLFFVVGGTGFVFLLVSVLSFLGFLAVIQIPQ